jgi:hypothetical protein
VIIDARRHGDFRAAPLRPASLANGQPETFILLQPAINALERIRQKETVDATVLRLDASYSSNTRATSMIY